MRSTPNLSKKTRTMRARLTEAEWEYISSIASDRGINRSEALRWIIHQSILLTTILLENPEVIRKAKKVLMELPHMKRAEEDTPPNKG